MAILWQLGRARSQTSSPTLGIHHRLGFSDWTPQVSLTISRRAITLVKKKASKIYTQNPGMFDSSALSLVAYTEQFHFSSRSQCSQRSSNGGGGDSSSSSKKYLYTLLKSITQSNLFHWFVYLSLGSRRTSCNCAVVTWKTCTIFFLSSSWTAEKNSSKVIAFFESHCRTPWRIFTRLCWKDLDKKHAL